MDMQRKSESRLGFYLLFGAVAGALWAQLPMLTLKESGPYSFFELVFTLFAGALTGVTVTLVLGPLVRRKPLWAAILFGILALPLGAFLYGITFTLVEMAIELYQGTLHLRSSGGGYYFGPIERGLIFIYGSCATVLALLYFPLSASTTLLLWKLNRKSDVPAAQKLAG